MSTPSSRSAGIGRRLFLAFGVMGFLVLACAGGGMLAVDRQRDLAVRISAVDDVVREAENARLQIAEVSGWQGLVVAGAAVSGPDVAPAGDSDIRSALLAAEEDVHAWLAEVDTDAMSDGEQAAFARLRPAWDDLFRWNTRVVEWLATDPRNGAARALAGIDGGEAGASRRAVLGIAGEIHASATQRADALRAQQVEAQRTAMVLLGTAGLMALVGSFVSALLVTRSVVGPLGRVRVTLAALARGNLTADSGVASRDEVGRVADSLAEVQSVVRALVAEVARSADAVAASSRELAALAARTSAPPAELSAQSGVAGGVLHGGSRGTRTGAASADRTGASIRQTASDATATGDASATGDVAVRTAATSTRAVVDRGFPAGTGNLAEVMTSIAEQTNLLALNATIEAARAGEGGMGSAAVADAVEDPGRQTAEATEEIARRVQSIRDGTTAAVAAIEEIGSTIARSGDPRTTIAGAVDELSRTAAVLRAAAGRFTC